MKSFVIASLVTTLLSGCVNYAGLTPHSSIVDLSLSAEDAQWPKKEWWADYNDAVLSDLIEQALSGNPNIKIAQARLEQVAAITQTIHATTLPQAGFNLSVTPEHFTENFIYPPPFAGTIYSTNMVGINAKYEFDFWGKHRAALAAAINSENAARAELQSARILIAVSVAKSYFALAQFLEQKKILEATLQQREELITISRQRVEAGLDTKQASYLIRDGLPAIRAQLIQLDEQVALSRNALAALCGQAPEATEQTVARLPDTVSVRPPESISANLIGRRADISAARSRVEAAAKQITSAKRAFYPDVSLSVFGSLTSLGFSNWLKLSSRDYGVGPALSLPIFDGGRLRANLMGRDAEYDVAVESYNQTLIEAVHDIANQISGINSIILQQQQQAELQRSAEAVFNLATEREHAGLADRIAVLSAQTNVLAQQSAAINIKARAVDLTINLTRALGGGFDEQQMMTAQ